MFRVWFRRMTERLYVTGEQKIEWFDLLSIGFAVAEPGERSRNGRTTDRNPPDSGHIPKVESWRNDFYRPRNDILPNLCNPFVIFGFRIGGFK